MITAEASPRGQSAQALPGGDRPHLLALDGVRGLAILLVLLDHALAPGLQPFGGFHSFVANLLNSTGYGVQLFFVLSGFLITGILLDAKHSAHYFKFFYARRILRIFPLYYGTILVFSACVLVFKFTDERVYLSRLPWLLTYTQNILITLRHDWSFVFNGHSLGHFWSLAVEEQFYLVWPMVVLWCSPRVLKRLCYVAFPIGLISRAVLVWPGGNLLGALVFLPCEIDPLALGALLAVLVREQEATVARLGGPALVIGGAIWLITCLDMRLLVTLGVSGFMLLSAGLLAAGLYLRPFSRFFCGRVLRSFGKYSYAIYVLHVLILPFILPLKPYLHRPAFTVLFIGLSYLAGWLSWHAFEVHFYRLKAFFPASKARSWSPRLSPRAGIRVF